MKLSIAIRWGDFRTHWMKLSIAIRWPDKFWPIGIRRDVTWNGKPTAGDFRTRRMKLSIAIRWLTNFGSSESDVTWRDMTWRREMGDRLTATLGHVGWIWALPSADVTGWMGGWLTCDFRTGRMKLSIAIRWLTNSGRSDQPRLFRKDFSLLLHRPC